MPDANSAGQRIMAFDFGLRRMGVAIGHSQTGTASPLAMIPARDGIPDWTRIAALVEEWRPDLFVVGLPLNMDDSESEMCLRARKFARRLHGFYHRPYTMVDERLTSFEAKSTVLANGKARNFGDDGIDDLAAVLILESWLLQQAQGPT